MSIIVNSLLGPRDQFNLTKFRANINGLGGPASTSNFIFYIYPPATLTGSIQGSNNGSSILDQANRIISSVVPDSRDYSDKVLKEIPKDFPFLVSDVNIPGRNIDTEIDYTRPGPGYTMPTGKTNDELTIEMYVRSGLLERYFFELWQNQIYNSGNPLESISGSNATLDKTIKDQLNSLSNKIGLGELNRGTFKKNAAYAAAENKFRIGWYSEIISNAELVYFDPDGETRFKVIFSDVYPKQVSGIPLTWDSTSSVMKLSVTFAYRDFKMQTVQAQDVKKAAYFAKSISEGNLKSVASTLFNTLTTNS